MQNRSRAFGAWAFLFAVIALFGETTLGQEKLSSDIIHLETPPNADQQNQISIYTSLWTERLKEGPDEQVSRARRKLLDPLTVGGTEHFRTAYCRIAGKGLREAGDCDRLLVRLNALIVAREFTKNEPIVTLIQVGLEDDSPAIRYWAAQAVSESTDDLTRFKQADARQLIEKLSNILKRERSMEVAEQVLLAIVSIRVEESVEAATAAFNDRVRFHKGNPELPFKTELGPLTEFFQKLIRLRAENQLVDEAFRQTARAAGRYYFLLSRQATEAELDADLQQDYLAMATMCDKILGYVHNTVLKVESGGPVPLTRFDKWPRIHEKARQWWRVLTQAPYAFESADLEIPDAPGNEWIVAPQAIPAS